MNKTLIPEEKRQKLRDLLVKTEENIRQIQVVGDVFVSPVLNQWRCATVYAVRLLCDGINDADLDGLLEHIKKAYRDSCEILLDIHLKNAHSFLRRYKGVHMAGDQADVFIECCRAFSEGLACRRHLLEGRIREDADRVGAIEVAIQKMARTDDRMRSLLPEFDFRYREVRRRMLFQILAVGISVLVSVLVVLLSRW